MTARDQSLLLRALVDELARCGLREAVTCPGSRNTPIVSALVRDERVRCFSHVDERSGAFFAVGAGRVTRRPAVITVTSGTAVANLHPAVIEASEAGVPLIVLSADRPAELRDVGAGQTIDQVKLFGSATKWYFELDLSVASAERMRWVRSLACRAWMTATEGRAGVVHLNLPLREPLVAEADLGPDPAGGEGRPGSVPWVVSMAEGEDKGGASAPAGRAIIVAGELPSRMTASGLAAYAERTGIPLLADPLSDARRRGAAIAHYDLILRDPRMREALVPDQIWRVGGLPTSKPLRSWLAELSHVPQIHKIPHGTWIDPAATVSARHSTRAWDPPLAPPPQNWLAAWRFADATVAEVIDAKLGTGLNEPRVAQILGAQLPHESILYLAASMPIRDVEEFVGVRDDAPRMLANRGANGIDGTVSAAFGAAAVSDWPVVLLIGDVALAHDIGGLLTARRGGNPITIVLINNDGGGIFEFLPIAGQPDVFAEHVATPHGLNFALASALYGLGYVPVSSVDDLRDALANAVGSERTTIIEVRTERVANRRLHAEVAAAALAALGRAAQRRTEAIGPGT